MYVLHLDRIERQVQGERQIAATLVAAGVRDIDWPTFDQARADYDAALLVEPKVIDRRRLELMQALGVA